MSEHDRLKIEIAQQIAQRIALDLNDWPTARLSVIDEMRRSYGKIPANAMPDSQMIESAVRECFALYAPDEHAGVLRHKRTWAKRILERLSAFDIYLTGAVLNGCATEESNICFALYTDDVKNLEASLFNLGIEFEAIDSLNAPGPEPLECLGFLVYDKVRHVTEGVRIDVYSVKDKSANPLKREPDRYQAPWESLGRIDLAKLVENAEFDD